MNLSKHRIFGVDFSGAADSGKKTWISTGDIEGETLLIKDCRRAETLQRSGKDRARCLSALRDFISHVPNGAFGLDSPFGLPKAMVKESSWEEFVIAFPSHYEDPGSFRKSCYAVSHGIELKRVTDIETRTPFSPYNLRLYRQTYYGISEILSPLVKNGLARVLPMQKALASKPWIYEVCPASSLKARGLYFPYKGRSSKHREARFELLQELEKIGPLHIMNPSVRSKVGEDPGGDGLDSVIAAVATFHALRSKNTDHSENKRLYLIEGYVYVG